MKRYPIVIQPNPRYPTHYRAYAVMTHFEVSATTDDVVPTFEFEVLDAPTLHHWSWSPRFWWSIAKAWVSPAKIPDL